MSKFKVGLGQINTQDNIQENLDKMEKMTKEMTEKGAELVVFPEYSSYFSDIGFNDVAEYLDGNIVSRFKKIAKKYNVYFHCGSFIEKDSNEDKPFNTSVFINPEGEIEIIYRKIHLFDISIPGSVDAKESDKVGRGDKVVNHSNEMADFGFSICYDIRFPELYRKLTLNGAKVIFTPAAFTLYTGKDHWETILRTRAIESQAYVIAPCQFGPHPTEGKMCYGNSMIIDPWGKVIARAQEKECVVVGEIDLDYVDHVRTHLPSLKNRVDISKL